MSIRIATLEDAPAIRSIYSQYIDTAITFENVMPALAEFEERISSTLVDYPYFVLCDDSTSLVIGYAYAHRFQSRAAYRWGAELSIYIDSAHTSAGAGRILYGLLIDILKEQSVRTVYGCVTLPNTRSERLHESMGFKKSAHFVKCGFKNGVWHDVAWYEKQIGSYDVPDEITPFSKLNFPLNHPLLKG